MVVSDNASIHSLPCTPYAHSFFTWALAKHGVGAGRAAGISGAIGAALPDAPAFAAAAYFLESPDSMPREDF